RMPVVSYRQTKPVADPDYWEPHELMAIHEVGGWVDEVYTRSGAPVPRVTGATVVGRVTEQNSYRPIPGVAVELLGSAMRSVTGETGRYRIDDVPEGEYFVILGDEFLDSLGYVPPPIQVRVEGHYSFEIDVAVVPRDMVWSAVCPDPDQRDYSSGIVTGLVREAGTGMPVRRVRVGLAVGDSMAASVHEPAASIQTWQTVTNDAGYYRICGVPADVPLTATVSVEGRAPENTTVSVSAGGVIRLDFSFEPERR
ncbi:MAG: carboxypeptidase regulatory-like domain-containing protein, partial [Gemmatimonadota bacterium]